MRQTITASRWITSAAALALLAALAPGARAADDAPAAPPAGKATISVKVVDGDGKAVDGAKVNLFAVVKKAQPTAATGTPAKPMAEDPPMPPATPPATPPADGGDKPKRAKPKPLQMTTSDAEGAATFTAVADGTYTVRANLKGTGRGTEKVTVAGGKDVTVTVTLKQ